MKLFECQNCGQPLYFENTRCESCGLRLGYLPSGRSSPRWKGRWRMARARRAGRALSASAPMPSRTFAIGSSRGSAGERLRRLPPQPHHSRSLAIRENLEHWRKIEFAKHRLFYTLLRLRLPLTHAARGPERPRIRFPVGCRKADARAGDDRACQRPHHAQCGGGRRSRARARAPAIWASPIARCSAISATRSRITIGIIWSRDTPAIEEFRRLFGDEREDYDVAAALLRQGSGAGLVGTIRHRLCQLASVGGFRRNLGALFSHGRHARNRGRIRAAAAAEGGQERRPRRR